MREYIFLFYLGQVSMCGREHSSERTLRAHFVGCLLFRLLNGCGAGFKFIVFVLSFSCFCGFEEGRGLLIEGSQLERNGWICRLPIEKLFGGVRGRGARSLLAREA